MPTTPTIIKLPPGIAQGAERWSGKIHLCGTKVASQPADDLIVWSQLVHWRGWSEPIGEVPLSFEHWNVLQQAREVGESLED